MKKKIFAGIVTLVFAAIVGVNVKMNLNENNQISDLSLDNAEALANDEHLYPGYAYVTHTSIYTVTCTGKGYLYCI